MTRKFSTLSFFSLVRTIKWAFVTVKFPLQYSLANVDLLKTISYVKEYNGHGAPSGVLEVDVQGYDDAIKQCGCI